VELKRDWPTDYNKAARRIAGHCNASAGDAILWIIGVDETGNVLGAGIQDLATWWPRVKSEFNGDTPIVRDQVVNIEGTNIVSLYVETDRAPFVVRNPAYGQPNGGPVNWEVPWRDATSVRSATRADLLRLLLPRQSLPFLEIVDGTAQLQAERDGNTAFSATITIYAVLPVGSAVVLPNHQASAIARFPGARRSVELDVVLAAKKTSFAGYFLRPYEPPSDDGLLHTVHQGDGQVILDGPGFFRLNCTRYQGRVRTTGARPLEITARLRPAGGDRVLLIEASLRRTPIRADDEGRVTAQWKYQPN
jgi:hypothetical protein